jgi:hypothetical protein
MILVLLFHYMAPVSGKAKVGPGVPERFQKREIDLRNKEKHLNES